MRETDEDALSATPSASEWPALQRVLGVDLLARLLGISTVSLRRYLSGARRIPGDVARFCGKAPINPPHAGTRRGTAPRTTSPRDDPARPVGG